MESEARYDARKAASAKTKAGNVERQNKNLHGEKGTRGLTGRWRNTYYENGVANPRISLKLVFAAGNDR